ncbi:hypothetical protein [Streptomyces sp. enrichment culture]|uniref:hypothetical protein n=1 Tax=Streptomyces sp. enrichment culture TaxID=1795815 RepID=UPI003F57E994
MSWSAVLPGTALRVLRAAAGRRALHVVLLAGGLFLLGMLCAEQAHAADGGPRLGDTVGRVTSGRVVEKAPAVRGDGSDAVLPDLRPVTEEAVRSVRDRVVRPVGDTVEAVTAEAGATAQDALSALPSVPSVPSAPPVHSPSSPGLVPPSSLPLPSLSLPPLSVLPDHSGAGAPSPPSDQQAVAGLPEHPATDGPDLAPAAGDAGEPGGSSETAGADDPAADPAAADRTVYGPASAAGGTVSPDVRTGTGRAGPAATEGAKAHGVQGDPDGSLGAASGADRGVPRHGDAYAVTPYHRIPLRLVASDLVRVDAVGTRDPYRDIPVSPA